MSYHWTYTVYITMSYHRANTVYILMSYHWTDTMYSLYIIELSLDHRANTVLVDPKQLTPS